MIVNVNKLITQEQRLEQYEKLVNAKVRERYSQSEENAILRKKIANIDKNNEFEEYNAYVESVKEQVKQMLNLTENETE